MAIDISPEEVKAQEEAFARYMPPEPTLKDLEAAPIVETLAFAGTENGLLLNVNYIVGGSRHLFINPTIAIVLVEGISEAGKVHNWWPDLVDASIALAPDLTREDLEKAEHVRSLRTGNIPDGVMLSFGSEQGVTKFMIQPNQGAAIVYAIDDLAKRAEWWDSDWKGIPDRGKFN